MNWYGVKMLFESTFKDSSINTATMLEQRVVLFKAEDFDKAIKKAGKEAKSYEEEYTNRDGHLIVTKFCDVYDAFEIIDDFEEGAELYSNMSYYRKKPKIDGVIEALYGPEYSLEIEIREPFLRK